MKFCLVLYFFFVAKSLFGVDFHDFDAYQYKLTAEEVERKIKTYLEKDSLIQKFYQLKSEALYIGNCKEVEYILHLRTDLTPVITEDKLSGSLKGAKIALDPGHFGGDFAEIEERCVTLSAKEKEKEEQLRFCEGDLTYLTALELKYLLEADGASVMVTRPGFGQGALKESFF